MACFGISSLGNLLPSWLRCFVVPSPDRPFTNSPRNIIPEPADWGAGRVSGVLELPLPPVHLAASPKSTINEDEYERWKPLSYNPILPMTKSRCKLPVTYLPSLGMLFIPVLFILFWVWCTNSEGIEKFLKYEGVRYEPGRPYCLWCFVKYDDSSIGYVGVQTLSFNADVLLQQDLKRLVPNIYWKHLQVDYGFAFFDWML